MSNVDLPTRSRQFIEEFIQWSADIKSFEVRGETVYDVPASVKYLTAPELFVYYLNVVRKQQL